MKQKLGSAGGSPRYDAMQQKADVASLVKRYRIQTDTDLNPTYKMPLKAKAPFGTYRIDKELEEGGYLVGDVVEGLPITLALARIAINQSGGAALRMSHLILSEWPQSVDTAKLIYDRLNSFMSASARFRAIGEKNLKLALTGLESKGQEGEEPEGDLFEVVHAIEVAREKVSCFLELNRVIAAPRFYGENVLARQFVIAVQNVAWLMLGKGDSLPRSQSGPAHRLMTLAWSDLDFPNFGDVEATLGKLAERLPRHAE